MADSERPKKPPAGDESEETSPSPRRRSPTASVSRSHSRSSSQSDSEASRSTSSRGSVSSSSERGASPHTKEGSPQVNDDTKAHSSSAAFEEPLVSDADRSAITADDKDHPGREREEQNAQNEDLQPSTANQEGAGDGNESSPPRSVPPQGGPIALPIPAVAYRIPDRQVAMRQLHIQHRHDVMLKMRLQRLFAELEAVDELPADKLGVKKAKGGSQPKPPPKSARPESSKASPRTFSPNKEEWNPSQSVNPPQRPPGLRQASSARPARRVPGLGTGGHGTTVSGPTTSDPDLELSGRELKASGNIPLRRLRSSLPSIHEDSAKRQRNLEEAAEKAAILSKVKSKRGSSKDSASKNSPRRNGEGKKRRRKKTAVGDESKQIFHTMNAVLAKNGASVIHYTQRPDNPYMAKPTLTPRLKPPR